MITQAQLFSLLPLIIVSASAVLVTLGIAIRRHHSANATLAVIGLNLALLAVVMLVETPRYVTNLLVVDRFACVGMALMLIATLACSTFAHAYQQEQQHQREEMYLLFLLALAGGMVLACSRHFASMFIGMEALSVPLYGLVAYHLKQSRSLEAGIKYLVLSATGSAIMLFGIALIYAQTGTLSFPEIGNQLSDMQDNINPIIIIGTAMIIVALAFKLSLVPFHLWTPDVYEGAPAPVTTFIATTAKIAVAMVLLRLMAYLPLFKHSELTDILKLLAVLSILAGNLLAMTQNNLKRLLAYSSIAHFGYLMIAISAYNFATVTAFHVYLISYTLATLATFGVMNMVSLSNVSQNREGIDADGLHHYRGLFWKQPYLAAIMTIALLSLAGIPMTIGFIGKFYVILAAVNNAAWGLLAALVIGSAIGIYYYLRVVVTMFLAEPGSARLKIPFNWSRTAGGAVLVLIAIAILLFGLFPQPILDIAAMGEML